jgi:hypothetical protein
MSGPAQPIDVTALAQLLGEAAAHLDACERLSPPHDWNWCATYIQARGHGCSPEEASAAAERCLAVVRSCVTASV